MVQPSEGLWLRESGRRARSARRVRSYGDGAHVRAGRSPTGSENRSPDCGRSQGSDGSGATFRFVGRAIGLALMAAAAACGSATTASEAPLERSPAGLDQVPITIKSSNGAQ